MSAVIESGSQYTAEYSNVEAKLPGQSLAWLKTYRSEALAKFSKTGFPSAREEEWRFTNVSAIEKKLFQPTKGNAAAAHPRQSISPELPSTASETLRMPTYDTFGSLQGATKPEPPIIKTDRA